MRAFAPLLICLPLLAACADIPSTEVPESTAIEDAAYPALVPQAQILNGPAPRTSQEDLHALQVRADGIDANDI
ncbi:MAG: hypothetical protein VX378_04725 [Pseudomonadota bacterium]|nr:hypothetical protein [Pseudomonadota bacterium]MEE3070381.1 hypothetical protein [Pseudomonadota bacterium]